MLGSLDCASFAELRTNALLCCQSGLGGGADDPAEQRVIVDILLLCSANSSPKAPPVPPAEGEKGEMRVVPVLLPLIDCFSSGRIYIPKDLSPLSAREEVKSRIQVGWAVLCSVSFHALNVSHLLLWIHQEVHRRYPDGLPLLDPIEDMEVSAQLLLLHQLLAAHTAAVLD